MYNDERVLSYYKKEDGFGTLCDSIENFFEREFSESLKTDEVFDTLGIAALKNFGLIHREIEDKYFVIPYDVCLDFENRLIKCSLFNSFCLAEILFNDYEEMADYLDRSSKESLMADLAALDDFLEL